MKQKHKKTYNMRSPSEVIGRFCTTWW